MLSWQKPTDEFVRRFLAKQSALDLSYPEVGATATTPPAHYVVDHTRIRLGEGESVFRSAVVALRKWEQFHLGWVEAWPSNTPIQTGEDVAVMGQALGIWWLNACRILYVVDEQGPIAKFGFAYGTLPGHVESGETPAEAALRELLEETGYPDVTAVAVSAVTGEGLDDLRHRLG